MPLKLVTGPANAEKAKVVLDGYRAALRRGEEPILVVPTFPDVERYRAELAAGGVVFGAQVVRFALAHRGVRAARRRARPPARRARPRARSPRRSSARRRCSRSPRRRARAASRASCCASSTSSRSCASRPQRLTQALRAWAGEDAGRRAYADEVSGLYSAYRRRLERLGRVDAPLYEAAALDALREDPAAWGATPVFFYGFDDLQPLQHDAVETLAATGAQVTLSLPYEPGRMAFAGRATTFAELLREGVEHEVARRRAPSTTRRRRARRCTTSSAACSRTRRPSSSIPTRSIPATRSRCCRAAASAPSSSSSRPRPRG